jgi:hypothetical protein
MPSPHLGRITIEINEDDSSFPKVIKNLDRVTVRSNGTIEWSTIGPDKKTTGSGTSIRGSSGNDTIEVTITIKRK